MMTLEQIEHSRERKNEAMRRWRARTGPGAGDNPKLLEAALEYLRGR